MTKPARLLILTTDRRREHYNCGSMIRPFEGVLGVWPEEAIEISPADAGELEIEDGETVLVRSRRGGVANMSFHSRDVLTNLPQHRPGPGGKDAGV